MSKIITVTLNPAIDHIIHIDKFEQGEVIRARQSSLVAAGKGINVARTISCLKKEVTAFCFVGNNEAYLFNQLGSEFYKIVLFPVDGPTRSNITVVEPNHKLITHLQTNGFELSEVQLEPFTQQLGHFITSGDTVVLSGSVAKGVPDDYYKQLIAMCNGKGCRVVFDSSGIMLKKGIEAKPYVIKPNIAELKELSGSNLPTLEEIIREAGKINEMGVELVFISRGGEGVILTRRGDAGYWTANVQLPSGEHEGDEIGCGDSMIGGVALSISGNYQTEDIIRMAVSCGAANILSKGPGVCRPVDVESLFRQAEVRYHNK